MTNDEFSNNSTIKALLERLGHEIEKLGSMPCNKSAYEFEMLTEIRAGLELWGDVVISDVDLDGLSKLSPDAILEATCLYIFEDDADRWLCSDFSSRDLLKEWISYVLGETC